MRSIAVLGPGGVGGLVAGVLARAGTDITVVAREETAALIDRDGLRIASPRFGRFDVRPRAVARLEGDVDILVVATKATGLDAALERIAGEPGLVVPLLNGVEHLAVLRARWGLKVCAAAIRVESERVAPGVVEHRSPSLRIDLAPPVVDVEVAAHVFRAAEIPTKLADSEAEVMWRKLARLNALACTTTAYATTIGEIRRHPRRRLALEGAVEETVAVARAEGAPLEAGDVLAEIAALEEGQRSSMARDVEAGRAPELDAIAGAVLRAGARHGIPTPTVAELVAAIRDRLPSSP
jgi:2-dehydropantoate 2-reductase